MRPREDTNESSSAEDIYRLLEVLFDDLKFTLLIFLETTVACEFTNNNVLIQTSIHVR